ncbi:MAG: ArnT family glycosyltransferase, partial [bacterium]
MIARALRAVWANIGFVAVAAVLVYCVVHAFDPPRLNWGDSASDYNAMTAGRNFVKYGFWNLKLTPHVMDPALMTEADRVLIYTHYPQLPDVMNGVLRVFGLTDLVQFRFVALLFSFGGLFFAYRLVSEYWTRQAAQIAIALWVMTPLWLQHADYLHHAPYAAFFGGACLYNLVRYLRHGERAINLALSGLCMVIVFFASYDAWIFIPVLTAIITFGHYGIRLPAIRVLSILAACAVAALALKWTTNAWALGGFSAFVQDLRFQFVERATNTAVKVAYQRGVWPTFFGRIERNFSLLLLPIAAFWALLPLVRRRVADRFPALANVRANPTWLLVAALPFLVIFTELWVGQYYPALLVVPFYAVACGVLIAALMESSVRWAKLVAAAIVAALALNSLQENAAFDKAFF